MPDAEHPWMIVVRRKLRERGFTEKGLDTEINRMKDRFPFLRGKTDAKTESIHRAIAKTGPR